MKTAAVLACALLGLLFFQWGECAPEVYSPVLKNVNVDNILANPKVVEYQIKCIVYDGRCDKIGQEVKRLLPEVGFACRGCSPDQKMKLDKIEQHVQSFYPQAWQDMEKRYGGQNEVASFSISSNPN